MLYIVKMLLFTIFKLAIQWSFSRLSPLKLMSLMACYLYGQPGTTEPLKGSQFQTELGQYFSVGGGL